jgi:ribosomal protein S6--L-glutamate ligase
MNIATDRPKVMMQGKVIEPHAIVPRIGAASTYYGVAVVRQFEMAGVYSPNSADGIRRSRDKLHAAQILSKAGVDLPTTGFASAPSDTHGVIAIAGGAPLIVKLLEGSQGVGVMLAETNKVAEALIGAFGQLDAHILVQEYIAESKGADVRALIVGEDVVAAMIRQANEGEFRSNLHRGGQSERTVLSELETQMALRAAKAMGLKVAGVDIIRSARGPLVLEVNSSPGLEGIERTCGVDVAGKIIDLLERDTPPRSKA